MRCLDFVLPVLLLLLKLRSLSPGHVSPKAMPLPHVYIRTGGLPKTKPWHISPADHLLRHVEDFSLHTLHGLFHATTLHLHQIPSGGQS